MRKFAIAISTTALLLFSSFPSSFAQQTSSNFLVETSPVSIHPGGAVSVRISVLLEPNSIADVVVRFVPPQGSVQQHQLNFRADYLGFASDIVDYPNDVANASTQQPGNYTVLVQNVQTARLAARASFQVVEAGSFLNFVSQSQAVFASIVVAGAGGLLTYWYNRLSANRETKVSLNQKKAESLLALRPHYAHVTRSTMELERLAEKLRGKNDDNDEMKREYRRCFYYLTIYVREHKVLIDKFGAYFLSDPRGEEWLAIVERNIINRLRDVHAPVGFDELGHILSEEQTLADLEVELRTNHRAYELYETFKNWIRNNNPQINDLLCDLKLFYTIINYETTKMFEDWYHEKEGVNQNLIKFKNTLISEFKKDPRYCNFNLDYLIDQRK